MSPGNGIEFPEFPQTPPFTREEVDRWVIAQFQLRDTIAKETPGGWLGAFPNFYYNAAEFTRVLGGTIFVKPDAGEKRHVPLSDLQGVVGAEVPITDFRMRMRAANVYAMQNGFVGGFPTFSQEDETVLLKPEGAELTRVPWTELGNATPDDAEGLFRATQDYANRQIRYLGPFPIPRFVGGFPTFVERAPFGALFSWTVLLNLGFAERHDVLVTRT